MSIEAAAPSASAPTSEAPAQNSAQAPAEKPAEQTIDQLSPKFAALSRKEKQIRESQKAVSESQKAVQAELARIEQEKSELTKWRTERETDSSSLMDRLKKDPFSVLKDAGLTFEDLTKMQLNDLNPTPEMLIERTRNDLESKYSKQLEDLKKGLEDKEVKAQQDALNARIDSFKSEITEFIDTNKDTYELTALNGAGELVYEVIEEFYNKNQKLLSLEDAAQEVEKYLEAEAQKILKAKKFSKPVESPTEAKKPETSPTLSNTLSAQVPGKESRFLSDDESKREAAKLLRWNT